VETLALLVDDIFHVRGSYGTAQAADINSIVENALAMVQWASRQHSVQTFLGSDLPKVMADSEAMKRVPRQSRG